MARSHASRGRRRHHPTGIVLALLVLAAVVAVVALVGVGGGGDDSGTDSAARSRSPATTEPPRTTTTTTRAPFTYTVQRGDVLSALARVFGVSTTAIVEANPNLDPDHLVEGQTFIVPSPIPLSLVVRPRKVLVGGSIDLTLKGAQEAETVVFEIDRPTGPFLGQAHTATTKGAVSASYELGIADPPGTYTVIARGDAGTEAQTTFVVQAR